MKAQGVRVRRKVKNHCDRWSLWSNQWISATFIIIASKEVELANLRILHHRYQPISIYGNCILWPESSVQTHKMINSQFFVACALDANYIVAFVSNAILKYFFNTSEICIWVEVGIFIMKLQKANIARKFWKGLHCRATDWVAKSTVVKGKV